MLVTKESPRFGPIYAAIKLKKKKRAAPKAQIKVVDSRVALLATFGT